MTAVAKTTSDVNTGCVAKARLTLTLSGSDGIDMIWTPVGNAKEIGTATLTSS